MMVTRTMPSWRRTLSAILLMFALLLGCFASPGALAKEHMKHYKGHLRVWAFTSIAADYDGATILRHWLHHYLDLGIKPENFLVVVNSKSGKRTKEVNECTHMLDEKGIEYVLWLSQYSSEVMYKYRMELQSKVDPDDWIVHADSDEFHYYGGKSAVDFLEDMEHKGFNEVRGQYVDRVSESGVLTKLAAEPGLFTQYPLQCQVIKNVANGRDFKTMAYRGYWRTDRGNHQVIRPARAMGYLSGKARGGGDDVYHLTPYSKFQDMYHYQCSSSDMLPPLVKCAEKGAKPKGFTPSRYQGDNVAVHHFKWHEGVLASIKDRLEYYRGDDPKNPRYAWYTDSEKLMASIGESGKVDVKKTDCKKSQPGAMVRGRNAARRSRRSRRRARALLQEKEEEDSGGGAGEDDAPDEASSAGAPEEKEEEDVVDVVVGKEEEVEEEATTTTTTEEVREAEIEQLESKLDVAEETLEVLEEQEGERKAEAEAEVEAEAEAGDENAEPSEEKTADHEE